MLSIAVNVIFVQEMLIGCRFWWDEIDLEVIGMDLAVHFIQLSEPWSECKVGGGIVVAWSCIFDLLRKPITNIV